MPQTYCQLLYHVVFGTKNRRATVDDELRSRLHSYLGGVVREMQGNPLAVNGVADHVHLLISLPPSVSVADAVRVIKTNSSKWIHETFPQKSFAWQAGYAVFTVSQSKRETVSRYIARQDEHHRRVTFKDELAALLRRHGISISPVDVDA